MIARVQRSVLQLVMLGLLVSTPLAPAHAGIVGTGAAMAMAERAEVVAEFDEVLARSEVRERLEALGVDPEAALARAHALTDAELAELQARLDTLPAGGEVLGVLGVVLVVLLVLELLGVTNVFTGL